VSVVLVGRDKAVWSQSWVLLPRAWSVCSDGSWRAVAAGRRHGHRTEHARSHTQVSFLLNYRFSILYVRYVNFCFIMNLKRVYSVWS